MPATSLTRDSTDSCHQAKYSTHSRHVTLTACIPVGRGARATAALDNLVCVSCGFVELYVGDPATREKIAKSWDRP